jgi:2'-5' RNA ligase
MRIFVALWPPRDAVAHLAAAVAAARQRTDDGPRWIPPERWHLTLAFVGEVDDDGLAKVVRRTARAAAPAAPLSLSFAGAGRFGSGVLWAGLSGDVAPLSDLAQRIGWQDKPFRPHLTLARAPGRRRIDLRPWVAALQAYAGPTWQAPGITVVCSTLGPEPRYDVLERIALGS